MARIVSRLLVVCLILAQCLAAQAPAKSARCDDAALLARLLRLPAPVRDLTGAAESRRTRAARLERGNRPPADDAPLEEIVDFWSRQHGWYPGLRPSDVVRERLLGAIGDAGRDVDALAWFLPQTQAAFDRVWELVKGAGEGQSEDDARRWLRRTSGYLRDELAEAAAACRAGEGWYDRERDLRALCALDWERALPMVARLAASDSAKSRALAAALAFEYGPGAGSPAARAGLAALAADASATAYERDVAVAALASAEWPGRDAWFLSLFADESLGRLSEGNHVFHPLTDVVGVDADHWVPLVAGLVAGGRAERDNAVACLSEVGKDQLRADAIRPLVPWLSDPEWSSAPGFGAVVAALSDVRIPESVPGLVRVVERDDEFDRAYAAEALGATYHEARALPVLQTALEREDDPDFQESIVRGVAECGALPESEAVAAVEAYAELAAAPGGEAAFEAEPDDDEYPRGPAARRQLGRARLGWYLAEHLLGREPLAAALLRRAGALRASRPDVASRIAATVHASPTRTAIDDLAARLRADDLDAELVVSALGRRGELRALAAELRATAGAPGALAGLAALVAGDAVNAEAVLAGADGTATAFYLAGARLTRTAVPVGPAGALLAAGDPLVARAAEAYLLDEDSPEARRMLLDRSSGTARIVGARPGGVVDASRAAELHALEAALRDEVLAEGGPDEVFALLGRVVVRVRGGRAEVEVLQPGAAGQAWRIVRDREEAPAPSRRELPAEKLAGLRRFVAERTVDALAPVNEGRSSCWADPRAEEYLHLTRDGGVRVFMILDPVGGGSADVYRELCALLSGLAGAG